MVGYGRVGYPYHGGFSLAVRAERGGGMVVTICRCRVATNRGADRESGEIASCIMCRVAETHDHDITTAASTFISMGIAIYVQ